ncbi:MAG: DUF1673 family protein [Candidatus Methanoperedens sp.]|nr:DUF1673 family protein [Candidatus Methanoperedens sp.]
MGAKEHDDNLFCKTLKMATPRIACSSSREGITMSTAGAYRPDEKDLEVKAPGNTESPPADISWKNRYRDGFLLLCISITYLVYSSFIRYEISMNAFKVALFIGIALFVLIWIFDSRWLDKIARRRTHVPVRQRWGDILFILVFILVLMYLESNYGRIIAISAFSGFSITAWIKYIQIVYWETKNRIIILTHGFLMPTIVIVSAESERYSERQQRE